MKSIAAIALWGAGGLTLFAGSFVVFSALSGAPLHQIALLKNIVPQPAEETAHPVPPAPHPAEKPEPHTPPTEHADPMNASIGVLGSFLLPSPFSASELSALEHELRASLAASKAKEARIADHERELAERERSIESRAAEMLAMRKELEKYELELRLREEELKRDESAKSARDKQSYQGLAKFFEEGDAQELAQKLTTFAPKDAAHILHALDEERASQLVNALPADKYQAYLQAFREGAEE